MYSLIESGTIHWPDKEKHGFCVSEEAKDLIQKLLTKDKNQRLGRKGDVQEILAHPWFKEINADDLLAKKIDPPFIPELKNKDDTSNFDEKFQHLEIVESIISPGKINLIEQYEEEFSTF